MSSVALLRCTRRTVDLSPYNLNGCTHEKLRLLTLQMFWGTASDRIEDRHGPPISSAEQSMNSNAGPVVLLGGIVM